ncbi:endonuclease/exonuclease/phosphatase family protein [Vibrio japonicus]|uniref:Endonuclease/exonuclease/phosphatase family protein n=1 Tax=Vibrio japonicus TaxID=1824638 RepID=A0ABY5LQQ5_9VIBR|nr:endonuclease/exonuclease/phosphatase family protein [Vibrio japonicus]UUM33188.1 endonuclease/exonuclease/phosphatase family protein [Vibrio japonicus]
MVQLFVLFVIYPSFAFGTTFTTWNIEWLSSTPSQKFEESQRKPDDVEALARHFRLTNSDVFAFQEVNDLKAIQAVVGSDYQIFLSDRSNMSSRKNQFEDINQYTGIAIKKGIPALDLPDLKLDSSPTSKLRFATHLVLYPDSKNPIHVLSLHLKSRCSGAYKNNRHCKTLKSQGAEINQWLREREANKQTYVLLGDFNHNLSYQNDWLWKQMSHGTGAVLATRNTPATCKVRSKQQPNKLHQFRSLIDHIVVSKEIAYHSVQQVTFKPDDVFKFHLSDHCPIQLTVE